MIVSRLALVHCLLTAVVVPAVAQGGVQERLLEHPPWYSGQGAGGGARIAFVPVGYQRGGSQAPIFDPAGGAGTAVDSLLADLNAYLDSVGSAGEWTRLRAPATGTPPDVYFGCTRDPADDCVERGDSALGRTGTAMLLSLRRPSKAWTAAAASALDSAGATHLLLLTLEVGQYWVRQAGLAGHKRVELGTGHAASLPWATSLETPVSVLQLTGVLVNRKGGAVRIGAEGIMAQRTSLPVSALGAQRLIVEEDIRRARVLRREKLPGKPLAWQQALATLASRLSRLSIDR